MFFNHNEFFYKYYYLLLRKNLKMIFIINLLRVVLDQLTERRKLCIFSMKAIGIQKGIPLLVLYFKKKHFTRSI